MPVTFDNVQEYRQYKTFSWILFTGQTIISAEKMIYFRSTKFIKYSYMHIDILCTLILYILLTGYFTSYY